jgi:16S rRNA (guanine527-N7)-methyltransferase
MCARGAARVSRPDQSLTSREIAAKETLESDFNVSRETMVALEGYGALLKKWASQINLIGPSTLNHFWERHVLDCAQLLPLIGPKAETLADFGTGAGLPGLVLARLITDQTPKAHTLLVEASAKRCGFLREAARILNVSVTIIQDKIEVTPAKSVDLVTARAFAPLEKLLGYAHPWTQLGARLIFLKGEDVQREIEQASTNWAFQSRLTPSITDSRGWLLEIIDLQRR